VDRPAGARGAAHPVTRFEGLDEHVVVLPFAAHIACIAGLPGLSQVDAVVAHPAWQQLSWVKPCCW
jgi:hypothetical protein